METITLSEEQIQLSTLFFSQVDTVNSGKVSILKFKEACNQTNSFNKTYDPTTSIVPQWLYDLMYSKGINTNSLVSYEQFVEYSQEFQQLGSVDSLYNNLNLDKTQSIIFKELFTYFKTEPEEIVIKFSGEAWFDNLCLNENLTDDTELTLEQLLQFEEKYNTTRYWPIAQ